MRAYLVTGNTGSGKSMVCSGQQLVRNIGMDSH
jgi:type II secretory ATPase GspE/PulE/Tfp pilus assembly ATPase PilB-like protein